MMWMVMGCIKCRYRQYNDDGPLSPKLPPQSKLKMIDRNSIRNVKPIIAGTQMTQFERIAESPSMSSMVVDQPIAEISDLELTSGTDIST